MIWRYEFIATRFGRAEPFVLDDGEFFAANMDNAKVVLGSVVRNIKVSGETRPDAVRLIDPSGQEVDRLSLVGAAAEPVIVPLSA